MQVRLVSWNVNGLRAVSAKPDWSWFNRDTAHIIGLQETKATKEQLAPEIASPKGWHSYFASSTVKKGYSGVAVFSQIDPISVRHELPEATDMMEHEIHVSTRKYCGFSITIP